MQPNDYKSIGFDYMGVLAHLSPTGVFEYDLQMLDLVGLLRDNGYRVGVLTNLDGTWLEDVRTGLADRVDVLLASGDTGLAKPDPNAYQLLADRLSTQPHELIFIDDQDYNLVGARPLGISSILFDGYDSVIRELKALGIKF